MVSIDAQRDINEPPNLAFDCSTSISLSLKTKQPQSVIKMSILTIATLLFIKPSCK